MLGIGDALDFNDRRSLGDALAFAHHDLPIPKRAMVAAGLQASQSALTGIASSPWAVR